jgi:hypothetical protein
MSAPSVPAGRPEIDTALILLDRLGLTLNDLISGSAANRPAVPTFAEFVPLLKVSYPRFHGAS